MKKLAIVTIAAIAFLAATLAGGYVGAKRQRAKDVAFFSLLLTSGEARRQTSKPDYTLYYAHLQDLQLYELDKTPKWVMRIIPKMQFHPKLLVDLEEVNEKSLTELSLTRPTWTPLSRVGLIHRQIYKAREE